MLHKGASGSSTVKRSTRCRGEDINALGAASLATNPAPLNTPITTTTTMATRHRALQPNHINPGMARSYEEGLGYDSTTLRTVIGNLSGGIYTALGGQARPLEGLERHSQLTNKP
jgi:hypothetical protein